jgi:hypothetical protein
MINTLTLTGWLTADPISRTAPGGAQRLCFDLHTKDSRGHEVQVACFIDSGPLMLRVEPLLLPGRGIVVTGEMTQREIEQLGRTKWIAREVRVIGCEVPNRSAIKPATEEAPL